MFLHIGNDINILSKDLVTIIDKNSLVESKDNKRCINALEKDRHGVKNMDDVKTYIITCSGNTPRTKRKFKRKCNLYTSNISSTTLLKRNKSAETRLEVR